MNLRNSKGEARVAFVVPRYGQEVAGGAELYCRLLAEHCKDRLEIDILTTCAMDYVTWANDFPAGEERINGLRVKRFSVDHERDTEAWERLWPRLVGESHTVAEEEQWMRAQGPFSSTLIKYMEQHGAEYAAVVFVPYLYATTYYCLAVAHQNAILLPAAHDELPIYLTIFDRVFANAQKVVCLTPEEMAFVQKRFGCSPDKLTLIGGGCESKDVTHTSDEYRAFEESLDSSSRTLLYMGRIDPSKGVGVLVDWFRRFTEEQTDLSVQLVLIGKGSMSIAEHSAIHKTGFVSDEFKFRAIGRSDIVVMPSAYESLSFAALEGWMTGKPLLVNGGSAVLRGHCRRSNGGLWYYDYEDFSATLRWLLEHPLERNTMAASGKSYVNRYYSWHRTAERFRTVVEGVIGSGVRSSGRG